MAKAKGTYPWQRIVEREKALLLDDLREHFVDHDTEYESDLLSDASAAEARVPPFHFEDRCDQFWKPPRPKA